MTSEVEGDPFARHRSLLFTVAYEMLGSAADAEDVVQEAWIRWDALGEERRAEVRDPRAYLVQVATRQALNRLRTVSRRREEYFGEWLPEPVRTSPDVAEDVELAEGVSLAMLTVLETLGPAERAVFVLREIFDFGYEEIATAIEKSPAAVRQIAHRAREHVAARRPRMEVDRGEQERVVERFLAAIQGGDLEALMEVLAPDVVLISDGGGIAQAAIRPIRGQKTVARLLSRIGAGLEVSGIGLVALNGATAALLDIEGDFRTAINFAVEDGRITRILTVRNPEKLARIDEVAELRR
ncbi:RNA polymerase sigma-70 factor [Thermoleophilia bacterium SCSIO 60948]|nr:RNA polymerase sigma-70 factor [Thermoleophilia bacterium SCSIO 60948]